MKKRLKKYLCIICVAAMLPICAGAEETQEIEGLHENLQRLIMSECFTEEELQAMNDEYIEYYSNFLETQYIPGWIYLHPRTTEEQAAEIYDTMTANQELDFSKGLRMSSLYSINYFYEYAKVGQIKYLFDGNEFWSVPAITHSDCVRFRLDGERIKERSKDVGHEQNIIRIYEDSNGGQCIDFLNNDEAIGSMLNQFGETSVSEVRIFSIDSGVVLYIRCNSNEYLAVVDEKSYLLNYDGIQPFVIYEADNFMEAREQYLKNPNPPKPTYEAEAEALQSEGLLFGNENGLDLLKPMTRIEAVTMILRAIGNNDTATASAFSDVPAWHWGYNAANVAYEQGITSGIGNGEFAPERTITAEEFSAMILRLTNIGDFDWQDSVKILTEQGIIATDDARTMDLFTRGDMAKIIYEIRAHGLL